MLLLAIPMYAAPFVLMSLIGFAVFMAIPRIRRYAVAAMVVPVAFGGCAAAGFISWVLICTLLLKIELRPVSGLRGVFEGVVFFMVPGVIGSAIAVWIVNHAIRFWHRMPIAPSWKERISPAEADY